jgi:N-hydroxyarylamine O-acetyltransferase
MRLHDYLRRVGIDDDVPPTVETLRRLHIAHRETFLFENLAIQTGGAVSVALDAIERKFIDERRGGYCFEHNTLFAGVLREIGFSPVTLLGRVRRGPPERWARTHMVLKVAVDGDVWLADVGFGGVGLLEPIRLSEGTVAEQAGLAYELRREPSDRGSAGVLWVLAMRDPARLVHDGAASLVDMYEFSEDPQTAGDVEVANHFTSTHPDSIFRKTLTIQRSARDGRVILRGDTLTRYQDGRTIEETIARERVKDVARDLFGIELPDGPFVSDQTSRSLEGRATRSGERELAERTRR